MIDARELRIGNKVKCKISNDAGIYTVMGIPAWGIEGFGDGEEPLVLIDRCPKQLVPQSKLKPIPLTTEILLKCGFETDKTNSDNDYSVYSHNQDGGLYLSFHWRGRKDGYTPQMSNCEGELETIGTGIKYLHQLQNLYFALTQKELEINL